ncbi:MAG: hypothetical protein Aurels2KO_05830 [Aureliella sp.]
MPRVPRAETFEAGEVCVVHCVQRCVRRAYLAGKDAATGKDYSKRRDWIRRRLEILSAVFGVDVLVYSIMSNHIHVVLRTRPDVVETWSNEEVALRWLRLFPGRRIDEHLGQPTETDVEALAKSAGRLKEIRQRLSDVSWFMRSLCEPIARLANKQDECTGRFWEGRFKAQRIADEAGLLACAMYVDLNPIRAAMADRPENATHTSAHDRIQSLKGKKVAAAALETKPLATAEAGEQLKRRTPAQSRKAARRRRSQTKQLQIFKDAWLAPMQLSTLGRPSPKPSRSGVRASDKGFLSLSVGDYLALLDWTGRNGRPDKRGKIPRGLQPILDRIGVASEMWCDLVWNFERYFGRSPAAGHPDSMRDDATRRGRRWSPGQKATTACFVS